MTTAVQNQNWAPIGNPEGKNLNPWQKLRPAKLAQIPPRDVPAASPSQGNLAEQTTITKAGTLAVTTYAPRWYSPYAATITNVRASVNTAPTGAAIIVDVLKNGSTIFTTTANRPTIAISGFTALGTPDITSIAAGDYFQIQIIQVGSTVAGADLTVEITYQVSGTVTATLNSASNLSVLETDGSPNVTGVKTITLPNTWETDNGSGSVTVAVNQLLVGQDLALQGDISPTQITADQNDYNPTGLATASVLRLTSDATRNITGLQGGSDGRRLVLCNIGAQNIVLKNASASSSAGNRFALNSDLTIKAAGGCELIYDSTASRWIVTGQSDSGAASGFTSPLTTKGDIHVYSTTDARLPIGGDNQALVLTPDSAQTTGMKWASLGTRLVYKTADESVTSSTALQDDDHLTFSIAASEVWAVRFVLFVDGATAGDFKPALAGPTSATAQCGVLGVSSTETSFDAAHVHNEGDFGIGGAPILGTLGAGSSTVCYFEGVVFNSTNAGNVKLQWAQGTSSGTATKLLKGSYLMAWKLA